MHTVNDVCQRYGVAPHTVLRWIANGELKAFSVGRTPGKRKPRWRISDDALAAFEQLRTPTPPPVRTRRKRAAALSDIPDRY